MARPMSWHPSSELNRRRAQMPTSEPTLGNTIVGLENLAVSNTPASVQQSIENAFAMGYGYPIAKPASMYEPSPMQTGGYDNVHACAESACNPYASYDTLEPYHYSETSTALTYAIYPPASNQVPQWPPVEPEITNNQLVAPQEPVDCLPMQWPTDAHQNLYFTSAPELPKKTSKELVGMGLYDNEDRDFMSTIHSAISDDPIRDSMGKGLKLEETWQPPVKDGDDDGDDEGGEDSDSTDEAEEVEEDSPVVSSAPAETPIASYPTYGDLSDKSFFFNEDEQYPGEDQYTTYLAYGQGIPAVQPKIHHSASWQLPMGLKGFRS